MVQDAFVKFNQFWEVVLVVLYAEFHDVDEDIVGLLLFEFIEDIREIFEEVGVFAVVVIDYAAALFEVVLAHQVEE